MPRDRHSRVGEKVCCSALLCAPSPGAQAAFYPLHQKTHVPADHRFLITRPWRNALSASSNASGSWASNPSEPHPKRVEFFRHSLFCHWRTGAGGSDPASTQHRPRTLRARPASDSFPLDI
ncbi:hypothetical protein EVG20_g8006 [Dentipellis fragilis]|uniref:Uncharacterized protein n=1 Tax=Dentipellis fragilis TaxID=205917 RepID=A0A4Y9YD85_9AGAM|nr:hypothetical protein EVG20_g8006 [Dentipellis fragilis]